jgi:hypothetical protein
MDETLTQRLAALPNVEVRELKQLGDYTKTLTDLGFDPEDDDDDYRLP